jgi:putative ABC transport system substrate-binding protein
MGKKFTILAIAFAIVAFTQPAYAQQAEKVYRIGYLQGSPNLGNRQVKAFRQGLRDLGYVEGKNITIEWRTTNRRIDRLPEKVDELVRLGLDCIVTVGVSATRAAKAATSNIPIVMADADDDPVRQGLIASYARPGGNVTGITSIASDLSGKRLQILKETVPGLSRLAVLFDPRGGGTAGHVPEIAQAARALGVTLRPLEVRVGGDVDKVFHNAVAWKADALLIVSGAGMRNYRKRIKALAAQMRLPVMYTRRSWVRHGGLMSYSANVPAIRRRAAAFVDKILKGARPADLPVERPTKFELVINLKTAKALGITFPQSILLRADKVIE